MTHRRLMIGALTLASLMASAEGARAATLYVSPTGSDLGTCTVALPCRQIRRALELVGGGDTIQVANGSYLGFDVQDLAGTPSAPIVIIAPGRLADITADAGRDDTILVYRASYIEIDGLRTFGSPGNGMHISTSDHITVRNCVFGNNTWLGLITGHADDVIIEDNEAYGSVNSHGIYTANSGDRPIIRRNRVHDNAENGIHMNGDQWSPPGDGIISGAIVEDNIIYNNGDASQGAGINMDGVQDSIVRNNLIYNNRRTGIRMYAYDGSAGPINMRVYNNTLDLPADAGTGMSIRNSAGANFIRNNILLIRDPSKSSLKFGDDNDVALNAPNSNFNILDRVENENDTDFSLAQWKAFGYEPNSFSASPTSLWVNPAGGDYHLSASSPALNAGQNLGEVPTDIEGVTRPQGSSTDIGAYERLSGPALSINNVTVTEGNVGTVNANFTVTLSPTSAGTVTVNWATANGTATQPADYAAVASTALTFNPGESTKTVTVAVNGDLVFEPNETFFVNLSGASGATIADNQGQGTINNDDSAPPDLTINDVTVTEGNAGTVNANFTVTLFPAATGTVTVNWATANGSAAAPTDYASGSGSLTYTPGQTTKTVTVVVNGDTSAEANENFFVNLTGASGANMADTQGQGTITNDDALTCPGTVQPGASYNTTVAAGSSAQDWLAQYTPGAPDTPWIGQFKYVPLPRPQTVSMTAPTPAGTYELRLFANNGYTRLGSCTFQVAAGPALTINDVAVTEGNAGTVNANFTVTLSPTSAGTVTVNWATANGTATSGSDYVAVSGSLTFSPGESTKTVTVVVNGDTPVEPNETFFVNLSGASGANIADAQGQGTINNDDLPALSINDVSVTEGNGGTVNANFTVTLTPTVSGTVSVNWTTANGTATSGTDYAAASGSLTWSPGQSTKTVTVVVNGDTTIETNETFLVNLSGASGATVSDAQGQGTITNDDLPALSISNATVAEGNAGTVNATFTVTLSPTSGSAVTVNWATANGTATSGTDYVAGSGSLTFDPAQSSETVTVVVNGDTAFEPAETFFVNLSGASGATIADSQGQGTITNDDSSLSINDVTVTEGNAGTVNANFTVTLSPTSSGTVTVNWATANGTASSGSDYVAGSGSLTFSPGEGTKTVTVVVNGDTTSEPNETFVVNLSGSANIQDAQGQGTITNDDGAPPPLTCPGTVTPNAGYSTTVTGGSSATDWVAQYTPGSPNSPWIGAFKYVPMPRPQTVNMTAPGAVGTYELRLFANDTFTLIGSCTFQVSTGSSLSINDVSVTEGNAGTVNANFTVTLNPTSAGTVTVNWATADGTAAAGPDYGAGSGPLTFSPGESIKTVTVAVNGDTTSEANETFFVNLSGAAGANVADAQGQGTINNDDGAAPAVTCPAGAVGSNSAYNVTVNGGSSVKDWVAQYTPGSPNNPWIGAYKYVPLPRPQTVTMTAPGPAGTYELRLFANDGFTVIGSCTFQVATGPALTINDLSVTEGNAGTVNANFTVSLSPTSSGTVTVSWATANGTATSGSDYAAGSSSLTFNPGESSKTVTVVVNGDVTVEPDETFFVNLSGVSGATVSDSQGQGTITNDDAAPPNLTINDVSVTEGNAGTVNANFTVTLSPAAAGTVTVNWATANGAASSGSDYSAGSSSLTFNPGDTTRTVTVAVNGDTTFEANETFVVNLSGASGANISDSQGQGTITNDDPSPSNLSVNDVAVTEGNAGTVNANFTVTLSPSSAATVTVNWATANGTAFGGTDYVAGSASVTFNPGETTRTVTVVVNGDTTNEANETFFVNLSGASGGNITDSQGQGTINNDDASGVSAQITSPTAGSTLPGSSTTFSWDTGSGVTEFWLSVGTTPGGAQIYDGSQGLNRSRTVSNLPLDSSTVYVRLWSAIAGVWQFRDYTYRAAQAFAAWMNSPLNDATLPGPTVTFTWQAQPEALEYWISVGTTVGGTQVYDATQGLATSKTVTGIPRGGVRVNVRLWTRLPSGLNWQYRDYQYTAAP